MQTVTRDLSNFGTVDFGEAGAYAYVVLTPKANGYQYRIQHSPDGANWQDYALAVGEGGLVEQPLMRYARLTPTVPPSLNPVSPASQGQALLITSCIGASQGTGGAGFTRLASLTATFALSIGATNGYIWDGGGSLVLAPDPSLPNALPVIDASTFQTIIMQQSITAQSGAGFANVVALGLLRPDSVPMIAGNLGGMYVAQPGALQSGLANILNFPYWQMKISPSGADSTVTGTLEVYAR